VFQQGKRKTERLLDFY